MSERGELSPKQAVLGCLAMLLAMPFGILAWAYVKAQLWSWFLVPLGVPPIGVAHAYGLTTLYWAFASRPLDFKPDKDPKRALTYLLSFYLLGPLLSYGFGYVIIHWIGI